MDKPNTFRSSNFYMSAGDVLHMIITDETGTAISVELYGASDPDNAEAVGYGDLMDYDGNVYTTVVIGTQMWIIENYRTTHYEDGSSISNITDNSLWLADTTGAYCWYNNDETTYKATYGALYNWYAINNASGFCYFERDGSKETGWRVPTYSDFVTLQNYVTSIAGGAKLKEVGTTNWLTPNSGATDTYGFKAVPAGIRSPSNGVFYYSTRYNYIMSTTETLSDYMFNVALSYDNILFPIGYALKTSGYSVRCVKDTSTAVPVTISVDSTPGFTISSEVGYAIIGNTTMRVTFMCDAFPTVGGGSFGIEITDASSNVLLRIEADGSNLLGETGVFFDSDTMWPNYGDTLTLSRAIVTGDSLTVKVFGSVA